MSKVEEAWKLVQALVKQGFPESTAKKIASGELPMDQASRMARAREQGQTVDVYHGTTRPSEIDEMRASQDGTFGKGVYLAPDPQTTEKYAGMGRMTETGGSIYPLKVRDGKMWDVEAQGWPRDSYQGDNDDVMRALQDEGYIGINGGVEKVVFDPSDIRSTNAAFDPDNIGKSNILGNADPALLAGTALGTGAATQADEGDLQRLLSALGKGTDIAFDAIDMPMRGYHGLSAMLGTLAEGQGFDNALNRGATVARQPLDETAGELGRYTADKTKNPYIAALVDAMTNVTGF